MWRNRASYLALLAALAILLYFFQKPFLLAALALLTLFALVTRLLLSRDARRAETEIVLRPGAREGKRLPADILVRSRGRLLVTRSLIADVEVRNEMTGTLRKFHFVLPLRGRKDRFELPIPADACGALHVSCVKAQVQDLLNLFQARTNPFPAARTTVYPHGLSLELMLTGAMAGAPKGEGFRQNRKGSDPSETFENREYVPGDDIRSIHWKLSSKTDQLIIRQAGAPSHYDLVLLPDLGMERDGTAVSLSERNAAIAYGYALGEQLLRLGLGFCLAIPAGSDIELREVRDVCTFRDAMSLWLNLRLPRNVGDALQIFRLQHLDALFSRMVLLCPGKFDRGLGETGGQMGLTVLSVVTGMNTSRTEFSGGLEIVEVPAEQSGEDICRILC